MTVLVINSSPYMRRSNTTIILNSFLSGLRETGAIIENVNLNKLSISPCRGDLSCWFRQKGKCIQNDDMAQIIESFKKADIIVFSTPVYCDGVPGQLKVMMDRMVILGNPLLELRDNHTRHPFPSDHVPKKFVLIASCGLWEIDNFTSMVSHLNAFCKNIGLTFCGSLLRPHAFAMKNGGINDILHAAKVAGREVIESDIISTATINIIGREIVTRDKYIDNVNAKVTNLSY